MDSGEIKIARALASSSFGRRTNKAPDTVYFIQSGTAGPIKIGTASHPKDRLRQLQAGNPELLSLLGTESGGMSRETELHAQFRADHITGEWFRPSDALSAYIAEVVL